MSIAQRKIEADDGVCVCSSEPAKGSSVIRESVAP
jgi:hypothetical protein